MVIMTDYVEILRKRMREVTSEDASQNVTASKLNMTQGNVSKKKTGSGKFTLENVYDIAKKYDVSADWLLGLSEKKTVSKLNQAVSYLMVVEALMELVSCSEATVIREKDGVLTVEIEDPVVRYLLSKATKLRDADQDSYESWKKEKLSCFEDRPVVYHQTWDDDEVFGFAIEADSESSWAEACDKALQVEERYAASMES